MSDPVVYVEQQFNALKSFMRRQPSSWEPTGNAVVDAANRVRFQLKDTATGYAYTIRKALRNAAEIYGMNPDEPKITIHDPKKPNEQIDARQQRRIVELHEEFNTYILEHGIPVVKSFGFVSLVAVSDIGFNRGNPQIQVLKG